MTTCELCGHDSGARYLCERHALALAGQLEQLPALAAELVDCLVPRRSGFGELVTARTAGPRSPINEAVLDLMQSNHVGEVVHSWRVDVQRERWPQHTSPPPSGLAADCRWLVMEMEWIAGEYPAAGDLAREVRAIEAELRSLVGDPVPRRQRLGTCVTVTADDVVCGAVISRLPGEARVRCRWCGFVYESAQDWMQLQHFQFRDVSTPGAADASEGHPSRA